MANWVIVAALGSILATVWLGWLLYRINQPPAQRRDSGDGGVAGGTSESKDWDAGSGGGGDGGGD